MDWWFGSSSSAVDVGNEVLLAYWQEAAQFQDFISQYPSYDSFVAWAERATALRQDIGELIANTSLTNSKDSAINRVIDLARKSYGTAKQGDILKAAGGSGDTINWYVFVPAAAKSVAEGVVEETLDIAQSVGEGVTGSLKMVKYLPFILLGAGALWIIVNKSSKTVGN